MNRILIFSDDSCKSLLRMDDNTKLMHSIRIPKHHNGPNRNKNKKPDRELTVESMRIIAKLK